MHITFGLHLDPGLWPHPLHNTPAIAGHTAVGPLGLLDILETHLGLTAPAVPASLRIAAFTQTLQHHDTDTRFYHRSFARDPWGVSAHLLTWHDQLIASGWDATPIGPPGTRLHDFTTLAPPPHPSAGQRLWTAIRTLPPQQTFIDTLTLTDPIEDYPHPYRLLFDRLYVPIHPWTPIEPATPTLLHFRGGSPWETAEILAAWLHTHRTPQTVVIAEGHRDILDAALHTYGLATLGSDRTSRWRPATQVLPLLLSLAWQPLDPYRLLEYLCLPRSPLPLGRRALADALLKSPGIGSDVWKEAWAKAAQQAPDLDRWLGRLACYDRTDGTPIPVVRDTAASVAQWAGDPDDPFLRTAHSHAVALQDALALWPAPTIPAAHLDQLLTQITDQGTHARVYPGEVGRCFSVHAPAAVLGPADTIVWWHFVDAEPTPPPLPWTTEELAHLAAAGVVLTPVSDTLRARARNWRRPLAAARRQLVFASWERDGADPVRCHPLSDELGDFDRITVSTAQALQQNPTGPLLPRPGIEPGPTWQVAAGLLGPRSLESATSIEALLQCPLKWTLHYHAHLKKEPLMGLPDQQQLFGLLAHRILETVLMQKPLPAPAAAAVLAGQCFDQYVLEMAAAILQKSRAMERSRLLKTITRAASQLVAYLHASPYQVEGVEVKRQGTFGASALEGAIDVLLSNRETGAPALLDIKWTGRRYRKKLLAGTAIQLAIYSHLVQPPCATESPAVGYYSVHDHQLLVPPGTGFRDRTPLLGPALTFTWDAARQTHDHHLAELAAGTVRATGHDDVKEDVLTDGVLTLKAPCTWCDYAPFCGVSDAKL